MKNVKIVQELNRIAAAHGGILHAEHVVETARNPKSVLHSRFQWDDTVAAEQWRLHQARQLIQVVVTVLPGTKVETNAFISLSPDRSVGGGYRLAVDVMAQAQWRNQMLADALSELNRIQKKYAELRQLSEVFEAIRSVKRKAA